MSQLKRIIAGIDEIKKFLTEEGFVPAGQDFVFKQQTPKPINIYIEVNDPSKFSLIRATIGRENYESRYTGFANFKEEYQKVLIFVRKEMNR